METTMTSSSADGREGQELRQRGVSPAGDEKAEDDRPDAGDQPVPVQKDEHATCSAQRPMALRRLLLWASFPLIFSVELLLKYLAHRDQMRRMLIEIPILHLELEWTYSQNHRSALGFLGGIPHFVRNSLYVLAGVLVVIAAIWAAWPGRSHGTRVGVAFFVVGGFGNLVDRALISCVVDYLKFRAIYDSWVIYFNVSDLLINVGFGILFYKVLTAD
eukprot:gnl/TRDRNA2_/TRDRNA2_39102_c0_seq1.p1 gnl/TRDRNA2_/TRDRNA2_39102_c0~~gnl/TRDRNA2_/TRDRNA2_39102_c0_seq1.p1  ORF type:complete len:217 (-),score=29.34 gnl/TRDRNA2_/TRDRNA2_39102_c0_seq1:64-714(-)